MYQLFADKSIIHSYNSTLKYPNHKHIQITEIEINY